MQAGYVKDVEELLDAYAQLNSVDFSAFRALWSSRHFTLIHEGRPSEISPKTYMQILYSSALCHLGPDAPFHSRVGALYALYCLYHTQNAEEWPKVLIYTSIRDTKNLLNLAQQIWERQLAPAFQILHRLVGGGEGEEGALMYGAIDCSTLSAAAKMAEMEATAKLKVAAAKTKLFANLPLREHLEQPMGRELDIRREESSLKEYSRLTATLLPSERGDGSFEASTLGAELRRHMAEWDSRTESTLKAKLIAMEGSVRGEGV